MIIGISIFIGLITGVGIYFFKSPFEKLALSSVGLLNVLLKKEKDDEFASDLEKQVKSASSQLVIFIFLSLLFLAPTIWLFGFSNHYISDANYTSNTSIFLIYTVGTIVTFVLFGRYNKNQKSSSDYSFLSMLLHRMVLQNFHLNKWMLNKQIAGISHHEAQKNRTLLITGLARSGTTAITRTLFKSNQFESLNYSNMPFVMYPKFWAKWHKPKKGETKDRAHNDGIRIGFSSVEALEEYFFKAIKDDGFIHPDGLTRHDLSREEYETYKRYRTSIAGYKIYLAKNNNHILRLKSLYTNEPKLNVVLLFRDPLQHAFSLFKQHQQFSQVQKENPFALEYMDWLGHHEFGLNQKPFLLRQEPNLLSYGEDDLGYWVERWISYYEYALTFDQPLFVDYQDFLNNPTDTIRNIGQQTGLNIGTIHANKFSKSDSEVEFEDAFLRQKAYSIYSELVKRKVQAKN